MEPFLAPSGPFLTNISMVDTSGLLLSLSIDNTCQYSPSNTGTMMHKNSKLVYSQTSMENSPND